MAEMNQQPQGPDFGAMRRGHQAAQQALSSTSQDDASFDSWIDSLLGHLGNFGTMIGLKSDSLVSTGVLANITPPEQMGAQKSINQGARMFSSSGGVLANNLSKVFKVDFSKVVAPPIEGMPIMAGGDHVSYAALGGLSSQEFAGSSGKAAGVGSGFSDFG